MKKKLIIFLPIVIVLYVILFINVRSSFDTDFWLSFPVALVFEMAGTLFYSLIFFKVLAKLLSPDNSKDTFWVIFLIRVIILLVLDLFYPFEIMICDFFFIFASMFISIICCLLTRNSLEDIISLENEKEKKSLILENLVRKKIDEARIVGINKVIPVEVLKKKRILNVLFAILLFIYISLIFFHLDFIVYFIGLAVLITVFVLTRYFNVYQYLGKKVKGQPNDEMINVIVSEVNQFVPNNINIFSAVMVVLAFVLSLVLFYSPHILYQKVENGYEVKYYVFGIKNITEVTIPEKYKGEEVLSLGDNVFSNMLFLKKVSLPDTLTSLGSYAFYFDVNLTNVKLSENLKYIEPYTFYACSSLKSINIPNSVVAIEEYAFYGASYLSEVGINDEGSSLSRIEAYAFRNCDDLKAIKVPQSTLIDENAFDRNAYGKRLVSVSYFD